MGIIGLRKKPVDIYQVAEIVTTLCEPLTIGKELKLINGVDKAISPVLADEERLQQIINNLVGNAIKFTDKGEVGVTAVQRNGRVTISVHDTGMGIAADRQETIFTSFEQADLRANVYYQGTGLGLSIVKHLVELHGGSIHVDSEIGKGSVFSFDLETSPKPAEQSLELPVARLDDDPEENILRPEDTHDIPATIKSSKILVVDDEPINLQVVASHLDDQGYSVQMVSRGEEALYEIGKQLPDLVLLDIMMPKMSGFEVCREIREKYSKSKVVIIFLTAKNQVSDLVEGFALGANDYLSKPFSKNELLTRVRYHLENSQMAKRLIHLSEFSCRLSKLKDLKKVFQEAFDLICTSIPADCGVLRLEGKIIVEFGRPTEQQKAGGMMLGDSEINDEISLHSFQRSTAMLIRPRFFLDFEMMIVKEHHSRFSEIDVEFVRNVLTTIKVTRDNIREIITDARLLSGLHQIRESLKSVIYIKAQRNYCMVICDEHRNDFELRIPIQKIQSFFKESELLKVNRSILINPAKVQSLKKVAKQKYSVLMPGNEKLPISRSQEKQVREFFMRN